MPVRKKTLTKKTAKKTAKPLRKIPRRKTTAKPAAKFDYKALKSAAESRGKLLSMAGRDIAAGWDEEAPSAAELKTRDECREDLRLFLESYFPQAFPLKWSADHLQVISTLQRVILGGGLSAIAMPRGSGKTTIVERAALWALLFGHRRFVVVVGATEDAANKNLQSIKSEIQHNELLRRPFRHACFPIRALENESRRCSGQLFNGAHTLIGWKDKSLTLPTMPDSPCSGYCVSVCGITGALRGQKHTLSDGTVIRPDLVLLDDIQTHESAMSVSQCADRLQRVRGDVLNLAGPGSTIAAVATLTVIRADDVADQLLDRKKAPEWQGIRAKFLLSEPANSELWDTYLELRAEGLRQGNGVEEATGFYVRNRAAMDAGARVAWPERKNPGDISALQWAFNTRSDIGDVAWSAEFQNDPQRDVEAVAVATPAEICRKVSGWARGEVPDNAACITAAIDVSDALLHYSIASWNQDFSGWVIDYGVFPDNPNYISIRKAANTLPRKYAAMGKEGAIAAGLEDLLKSLLSRVYVKEDGTEMKIEKILVDRGYLNEPVTAAVRRVGSAVVSTTLGLGLGPEKSPMDEWPKRPGERRGFRWLIRDRVVRVDTYFWKSFLHARLTAAPGDKSSLALFGKDEREHEIYASHLCAEYPVRVRANGRQVDKWAPRPNLENHYLDTLVYAACAASMLGCALPGATAPTPARRAPITFAELRSQRAGVLSLSELYKARYGANNQI